MNDQKAPPPIPGEKGYNPQDYTIAASHKAAEKRAKEARKAGK